MSKVSLIKTALFVNWMDNLRLHKLKIWRNFKSMRIELAYVVMNKRGMQRLSSMNRYLIRLNCIMIFLWQNKQALMNRHWKKVWRKKWILSDWPNLLIMIWFNQVINKRWTILHYQIFAQHQEPKEWTKSLLMEIMEI